MDTNLTGRKALVTGGARGIGASIARTLAARGADVVITYSASSEAAEKVVSEIRATGRQAYAVKADAGDKGEARQGVRDAVEHLGGLDIVVNNAGNGWFESFMDASDEHIESTLDVNIGGVLYTTHEALKYLGEGGRVISIGSVVAEHAPFAGLTVIATAKAALVGFTKALARDLGGRGVTVNVVQPGPIDPDGVRATGEMASLSAPTSLGRFGTAEEVAELVAWVASDAASFVTGTALTVDGGWTA
ncbi:SDR family NAD(P)-dependent oxidoreductase [Streptomyces fuscichromogenes]|uniref:SDR family NAD(P)-dependent oxidoreductase n=1 Tax=Streptomyces fuscichromogenes TaxID=1324013 RepID=UPI00382D401D